MLKIDIENTEKLKRAISMLSERELYKAIGAAGKRLS